MLYVVYRGTSCVACCRGWDAKQAALRLLFGTSLVLPPDVNIFEEQLL